jgi:ATP-dependent protease Clp ATPase subunit
MKRFLDEYVIGQDDAKKVLQLQFTIIINACSRGRG